MNPFVRAHFLYKTLLLFSNYCAIMSVLYYVVIQWPETVVDSVTAWPMIFLERVVAVCVTQTESC